MKISFYLLGIYVATIVITRIYLSIFPHHGPKIGNFQIHHYMYGLVLIVAYFLIRRPELLAIGSAWIVDELPLFFIFKGWNWPDDHWRQYHSWQSIMGILVISVAGYFAIKILPGFTLSK